MQKKPRLVVNNDKMKSAEDYIDRRGSVPTGIALTFQDSANDCVKGYMTWPRWKESAEKLDKWSLQLSQFQDRRKITDEACNHWLEVEAEKAKVEHCKLWDRQIQYAKVRNYNRLSECGGTIDGETVDQFAEGCAVEMWKSHNFMIAIDELGEDFSTERERVDAEMLYKMCKAKYETVARWINIKRKAA